MSRIKAYRADMAKWVAKLSWSGGQCRVTIPKGLVKALKWEDAAIVTMVDEGGGLLGVRRFIDGESLENDGSKHQAGSD